MTTDTQLQRARELLAAEYLKEGRMMTAKETIDGHDLQAHAEYIVLRAILAALAEQQGVPASALPVFSVGAWSYEGWDFSAEDLNSAAHRAYLAAQGKPADQHPDDAAVDRFAAAMKEKMAAARAKGRSGWDDPEQCSAEDLSRMLVEHVSKGDPRDVANFCMMLWNRGEAIVPTEQGQRPAAMREAAQFACDVLAEMYAKYGTKIGPFASQAQLANVRLGAALRAAPQPAVPEDGE